MPGENSGQGRYWMGTIPQHQFVPYLPSEVSYIAGQLEQGHETGYLHWQLLIYFSKKVRRGKLTNLFGSFHFELTRSSAARDYVWKDDTAVPGTKFELGSVPMQRNNPTDWKIVRANAKAGQFDDIPDDVYIRYYGNLRHIYRDNLKPPTRSVEVYVYWGKSRSGKSWRARQEAGPEIYSKNPRTKFWDGYRNESSVIIDEFRGAIDISNLLQWFDPYPYTIEVKGSGLPLCANRFWITSNLKPQDWYPGLDMDTLEALLNRFTVIEEMNDPWFLNNPEVSFNEMNDLIKDLFI